MKTSFCVCSPSPSVLLAGYKEQQLLIGGSCSSDTLITLLNERYQTISGILIANGGQVHPNNLYEQSVLWQIPLIGHWRMIFPMILANPHHLPSQIFSDFTSPSMEIQCGIFRISKFPVCFPSVSPYGWIISTEKDRIAIVMDGFLTTRSAAQLRHCNGIVPANCRDFYPREVSGKDGYHPLLEEQTKVLSGWGIHLSPYLLNSTLNN